MKKVLIYIMLLMSCSAYSQDMYSHSFLSSEFQIIYSAKYFYNQDQETEIDSVRLYTGQDESSYKPGTTVYNPYGFTTSIAYDSSGSYTLILDGIPDKFDSSLKIYAFISPNATYGRYCAALPVRSGASIRIGVLSDNNSASDPEAFRITVFIKKIN
jgi:hypothetical protein